MDKTQRIVVVLLVAAILFSVASIAFNLTVVGLEPLEIASADSGLASTSDVSSGNLNLVVVSGGSG